MLGLLALLFGTLPCLLPGRGAFLPIMSNGITGDTAAEGHDPFFKFMPWQVFQSFVHQIPRFGQPLRDQLKPDRGGGFAHISRVALFNDLFNPCMDGFAVAQKVRNKRIIAQSLSYPLCDPRHLARTGMRRDQGELLAPEPCGEIHAPNLIPQNFSQKTQDPVSPVMAENVVYNLKMVQIQ